MKKTLIQYCRILLLFCTTFNFLFSAVLKPSNADKIIVLDNGNLIEFGTHKELLEIGNKYKTLYDIQYGEKP